MNSGMRYVCAVLFALSCTLDAHGVPNCFVNAASVGGTGKSWDEAFSDLQSALTDVNCTEIWVAKGVYKPTNTRDRTISFKIRPGVAIYGGFRGDETNLYARLIPANATVLSGDIDGDDAHAGGSQVDETYSDVRGMNSYHVVRLDGTAGTPVTHSTKLDGFIITGGTAVENPYPEYGGGGLLCIGNGKGSQCSPELRNLEFKGNWAHSGGAIWSDGLNGGESVPSIEHVLFQGNESGTSGGAITNLCSSPNISDSSFLHNHSGIGGAVQNEGFDCDSSPVLARVLFYRNGAINGGAMMNSGFGAGESSPTLTNVSFVENRADSEGGAMFNSGSEGISRPVLVNVTFDQNSAAYFGGAIYNDGLFGASNPLLLNVILWEDFVSDPFDSSAGPEIYNNVDTATATIGESIVQGGCPAGVTCANLITDDPLLSSLADNGGFTPTMMPSASSPAIDRGDNAICPLTDQRGAYRFDAWCDIGAVERQPSEDHIFRDGFQDL